MEPRREGIIQQLLDTVEVLPEEQLREVTDFAGFLSEKRALQRPQRGSAAALLKHAGRVRFGAGEMERLLSDIDRMRELDLESEPEYLLDTNHATHLLAKYQPLVERIEKVASSGDRFAISMTVLGELHFDLTLLSDDRHFQFVDDLRVLNWLRGP